LFLGDIYGGIYCGGEGNYGLKNYELGWYCPTPEQKILLANTVPTRQPYPKLNVMGVKKEKHGCNENYTVTSFCLSLSF
jgi:hypothetical protein